MEVESGGTNILRHPEYEKFRNRKVPYYEDLAIIVGDDEANGEGVVTGIEADKDMEPIEERGISGTWNIGESSINMTDSPSTHVQEDVARGKEKSTKRKHRKGNNSAVESLAEAALRMASSMERPNIGDLQTELNKLNIGMAQLLKAIDYLGRDAEAAHIFLGLDDDLKVSWLDMVLK